MCMTNNNSSTGSLSNTKQNYLADKPRREANMNRAAAIANPILTKFFSGQGWGIESVEKSMLDMQGGVDYILKTPQGECIYTAFRLKEKYSKDRSTLMVRHNGAGGGRSEAQKIKDGDKEYKAEYYMQLDEHTMLLRVYKIATIREWLNQPGRVLQSNPADKSSWYNIPWSEIQPIKVCQL